MGEEEVIIERPVHEDKMFTFYRVSQNPEDSGITKERNENGIIKCEFTPEAIGPDK